MNKIHRTIWNVSKGSWVVASEHVSVRGKCSGGSLNKLAVAMLLAGTAGLTVFPTAAQAASVWNVSSGEWTTAGNWTGGLPTSSTQAIISNGGTATLGVSSAKTGASSQVIVGNTAATTGTLVLQNASTLTTSTSGVILGNVANSTGTAMVTGSGSTWTDSGAFVVGQSGTGTLNILSGGAVATSNLFLIANGSGSTGSVTVNGAGSSLTNSLLISVGGAGTGTLSITNGATVSNTMISGQISIGSAGIVTVDGAGSTLINRTWLQVAGKLSITNGGTVTTGGGLLGNASTAVGIVTIDGKGSSWTVVTAPGFTNGMTVGRNGVGTLTVQNGGKLTTSPDTFIGDASTGTGTITVTGSGSTWSNSGTIVVGNAGTGTVSIADGGVVTTAGYMLIANTSGKTGTVTVDGSGSSLTTATLYVGHNGTGGLIISDGGNVAASSVAIGGAGSSTGTGTVTVDGSGSSLNSTGGITVGHFGTGTLAVTDGGTVTSVGASYIGAWTSGAKGTVTVDGAGSSWTNTGNLLLGYVGTGALNITDGGSVTATSIHAGDYPSGVGTLIVDGSGSTLAVSGVIALGEAGVATMAVSNGAAVSSGSAYIGNGYVGTTTVSDATWTVTDDLVVGITNWDNRTSGTLTVEDGGTMTAGSITLGVITASPGRLTAATTSASGTVLVTGTGSSLNTTGTLTVGESGTGALTVEDSGTLTSGNAVIGNTSTGVGRALISGSGSSWTSSGAITVGEAGTGTLTIADGATVKSLSSIIGDAETGVGTVTIDGVGSTWDDTGDPIVGNAGTGTLTISNGGTLISTVSVLGNASTGTGTVLVTGSGSTWTDNSTITVGNLGSGTLTITDSGAVTAAGGVVVGAASTGVGTLNITDAGVLTTLALAEGAGSGTVNFDNGTLIATADNLAFITGFEAGDLNIANGGALIDDAGFTVLADSPFTGVGALTKQGSGTLIMTGDSTYTGGTTIEDGTLQLGNGGTTGSIIGDVTDNGTLVFDRSDVYTFEGVISGSGHVVQLGSGTTVLTAVSPYSGTTTVTAGTLAVGDAVNPGAALTGGGATRVASGATLGGYGRVNGTVTNNGTVAVANAISAFGSEANGTFTIGGTLINNGLAQVGGTGIGNTLMVNNYVGNSGTLALNTYLGTDGSPSDLLAINGGTATGTSSLLITNVGGAGALTLGNGILVVDALNGATTSSSAFTLGSRVIAGPYEYTLHRGARDGSSTEDWYLRSTAWLSNGADYRQEVSLYSALPSMTQVYGRELLGTLHQRVGEQEQLSCGCAFNPSGDDTVNGVWGRVINVRGKQGDGDLYGTGAQFDYKLSALQLGVDLYRHQEDDGRRDHVGIYGSIGRLNGNVEHYTGERAGTNSFDAYSLGAYATHYGASGWYVDSVLQGTWYENVKAQSSRNLMASSPVDVGLESKGFGVAASIEVGYPLELTDNWILEPQAQVVYQRVALNSASDVAANVRFAPATSMAERIGARLSTTRELDRGVESRQITPWVTANLWHESRGDNKTEISSEDGFVPFHSKLGGSWAEVGAGVTGQITRNTSVFAHASYEFGLDGDRQANSYAVGVRVNW
jgi:fibronectin-binding autotransporter adhesin